MLLAICLVIIKPKKKIILKFFLTEEKRDKLFKDLQEKDDIIKLSLEEGQLLLEDIKKVKKHLLNNEKLSDLITEQLLVSRIAVLCFRFKI